MGFNGYLYGPSGQQIFPTPRESPGKFKPRPLLSREVKRSISQYDHAELVSISASICCRIPALRAAIRDKNSWAFQNWIPIYMGEDEAWGEAAEEYLNHEVLPNAMFRELRQDFAWGMRVSGMGLDMHGDDLAVFTEDEYHNPKIEYISAPRIGNGVAMPGYVSTMFSGSMSSMYRPDGMATVDSGVYKGLPIYNGVIRSNGRPVAARVLGYADDGNPTYSDIPIGLAGGTHYACEMEFFGQGRGLPRPAASILHWMNKEYIDDQFLKGLANAAERTVIHKLAPGKDAMESRGNAITQSSQSITKVDIYGNQVLDDSGAPTTEEQAVFVERSADGSVTYIGADEDLAGLNYECPHPNVEDFAIRVLTETLADLGWSWSLTDSSNTSRAPTRVEMEKANNSVESRQSVEEARSVQFFQYAIAKGMQNGRIPKNSNGTDPFKWGIGFPAKMTVDQGNDVTASLNRLRMGLTSRRRLDAQDGYIYKHTLREQRKEVRALMQAASDALKFARGLQGGENFTFDQAMAMFYQPSPNAPMPVTAPAADNADAVPNKFKSAKK